jgi:hypothetical protein
MGAIEIGSHRMAASSRPGGDEGRLKARCRARAKDDLGNARSYEPRNLLFTARQVAGAWIIVLSIVGLGQS